eukprot:2949029-Amphidinium_carterae.1
MKVSSIVCNLCPHGIAAHTSCLCQVGHVCANACSQGHACSCREGAHINLHIRKGLSASSLQHSEVTNERLKGLTFCFLAHVIALVQLVICGQCVDPRVAFLTLGAAGWWGVTVLACPRAQDAQEILLFGDPDKARHDITMDIRIESSGMIYFIAVPAASCRPSRSDQLMCKELAHASLCQWHVGIHVSTHSALEYQLAEPVSYACQGVARMLCLAQS